MKILVYCYVALLAVISLAALAAYGADKKKAQKHQWRTKESVLLGLGFFGGGIGALLGMRLFRHKTKHWYFYVVNWLGTLWQFGLLVFLICKM